MPIDRRVFLKSAVSAAATISFPPLVIASSAPTQTNEPEDLVRMLVDADRDRLLDQLVARIRSGLKYETLLGAVAEACVREVQPYPHVGFKYHAFMVLHAVHRTTPHLCAGDRWLPILWSADVFKTSQAAEARRGEWSLGPVAEHLVPSAAKAEAAFQKAMDQWDPEAADVAIVGLWRSQPRDRVFEHLFRFGARDLRSIGHKSITVANCHRLLRVVDAEHAEPMLRSLVLALLNHQDEPNPATNDLISDRPWRQNFILAKQSRPTAHADPAGDGKSVSELLQALRDGSAQEASRAALSGIAHGVSPADIWSAVFAAAGDLMLKQSGIISVHANTTSEALHYAYQCASDPVTRRVLLLQAMAFLPLFRDMLSVDRRRLAIDMFEETELPHTARGRVEEIFAEVSADRVNAAQKTYEYLRSDGPVEPFTTLARRYTVDRNVGYHDYKFTEAVFSNAAAMRSPWRERYLACSTLYLNGASDKPNETIERARALLG